MYFDTEPIFFLSNLTIEKEKKRKRKDKNKTNDINELIKKYKENTTKTNLLSV